MSLQERIWTRWPRNNEACTLTFATARVISETMTHEQIQAHLLVPASSVQSKGTLLAAGSNTTPRKAPFHAWRVSSREAIDSLDTRDHIDWIIAKLDSSRDGLAYLFREGCVIDCLVRWDSVRCHGGPTLMPEQMAALASLKMIIWMDVYCNRVDY